MSKKQRVIAEEKLELMRINYCNYIELVNPTLEEHKKIRKELNTLAEEMSKKYRYF
jgi:ferritin